MAVIITNMDMPKSCSDCNLCSCQKIGLFYCDITTSYIDIDSEERDADCPLKSTDEIIKEFGNASSNYPEDDDYNQGIHYGLHVAEQIIEHILYGENTDEN
ncbi:MAG: hypothetical protein IKP50_00245 [Bacilli bacterium]|nr:hypothetical protein [Bacilli bacterium]